MDYGKTVLALVVGNGGGTVIGINHKGLVVLCETGLISELWLAPHQGEGWALYGVTKEGDAVVLHAAHSGIRHWKSLTTVASYIDRVCPCVRQFTVVLDEDALNDKFKGDRAKE